MSARSGILAGGNWIVDKLKVIDTYPQQDTLANILGESLGNGGSPFNVLMDLARLEAGLPLAGVGLVGDDADGRWIRVQCASAGIDAAQLRSHPHAPTSYTDVMTVAHSGRRTFFHQRGANAFLDVDHFDFLTAAAPPGKIFHLGYLLLLDRLDQPDPDSACGTRAARVLRQAREAGYRTCVDVVSEESQRFPEIVLPALRHADYCILNELEIERTTGIATRPEGTIDLAALEKASRQLLGSGACEWILVHFPEGATALGRDGVFHVQGSLQVPQADIVGTVGAGDAFAAGVLHALHEDWPIGAVLQQGIAVAASCLLGIGASDGIRPLAACHALAAKYGARTLER